MDPQLEDRLNAIEKEVIETKRILVKMRRVQRNANAFKLLYWGVIIGLGIVAIYAMKPYLEAVKGAYDGISGDGSKTDVKSLIDQYKSLQEGI